MDVGFEGNRLVSDSDECPYCNGLGKLNTPGAPDCAHCKGTGVIDLFMNVYPKNETKISGEIKILKEY